MIGNIVLKEFIIVIFICIIIVVVWKYGFRLFVCKCFFLYNFGWSEIYIRYLICEIYVILVDDLVDFENYSCLVILRNNVI